MTRTASFAKLIGSYGIAVAVPTAVNFALLGILTNGLPVGEYGNFVLASAIVSAGSAVTSQWLQQSALRFLPGVPPAGLERRLAALKQGLARTCAFVIAISAVGVSVHGYTVGGGARVWLFAAAGLATATAIPFLVLGAVQRALAQGTRFLQLTIVNSLLKLVLVSLLTLWLSPLAAWAVLGSAVAFLLASAVAWADVFLRVDTSDPRLGTAEAPSVSEYWAYGRNYTGWFVASQSFILVDRVVLDRFAGAELVAVYGVFLVIASSALELCLAPVRYAVHPRVVELWEEGEHARALSMLKRTMAFVSVGGAAIAAVAHWAGPPLVALAFPPQYAQGAALLPVLIGALTLWHLALFAQKVYELNHDTKAMQRALGVVAVLWIAVQLVVVPLYQAWGSVASLFFAYGLYLVWCIRGFGSVVASKSSAGWNQP